jgi:hypothetical protein
MRFEKVRWVGGWRRDDGESEGAYKLLHIHRVFVTSKPLAEGLL